MAKISDYAKTTSLNDTDLFIVEKGDVGTRTVSRGDLVYQMFDSIPEMHNQIWRGKSLGSAVSSTHVNNIRAGNFKDLWIGDYWTINGVHWRIMHFDYFYGFSSNTNHHAVIIPDTTLGNDKQWDQSTAPWGYWMGGMRNSDNPGANLEEARSIVTNAFTNVLTYKDMLTDGEYMEGLTRFRSNNEHDCTVELMSLAHVFGHSDGKRGSTGPNEEWVLPSGYGVGGFAGFQMKPNLIKVANKQWWTRDSMGGIGAGAIAIVDESGFVHAHWATSTHSVRPFFLIG